MDFFLRPNKLRARNAIILIWIVMGLEILSLGSSYLQYDLLQRAMSGEEVTYEAALANDSRERTIAIFYLVAYILSAITFIQWFRRAYYNLHQKSSTLEHSEGWAAGSWFVPIINLFRPFQIMREMFKETRFLLQMQQFGSNDSPSSKHLGLWWTLWIVNNLLSQVIYRLAKNSESIDQLNNLTIASMVSHLIGIYLAVITVGIIKEYSRIEHLLAETPDSMVESIGSEVETAQVR